MNALIQGASHKKRRVCRRQERNWSLTSREKLVALSVYVQSKYSEGAAVAYMMPHKLKAMKRKAGFDEEMETLCQQCPVRDWFREASVDQLEQIGLNPSTKKEWSIFCEAHAFLSEKYTFAWLQAENNSKGRAVTAVELADRFLGFLHGDGESTSEKGKNVRRLQEHHFEKKAGKRGLKLQSGMRKWCAAFKKKMECQTRADDGAGMHGHQRDSAKGGHCSKTLVAFILRVCFLFYEVGVGDQRCLISKVGEQHCLRSTVGDQRCLRSTGGDLISTGGCQRSTVGDQRRLKYTIRSMVGDQHCLKRTKL